MSKQAIAILIGGVTLGAAPGLAEETTQSTAPHVVSDYKHVPKFEDEKVVCRRITQTGTRVERKVCTTEAQRIADKKIARKMLDDAARPADRYRLHSHSSIEASALTISVLVIGMPEATAVDEDIARQAPERQLTEPGPCKARHHEQLADHDECPLHERVPRQGVPYAGQFDP